MDVRTEWRSLLAPGSERYLTKREGLADPCDEEFARYVALVLPGLDYDKTRKFYNAMRADEINLACQAVVGLNDRFFLLTALLKRLDADKEWLFARCREVEAEPDGFLDLWFRDAYKSTLITFAGAIQEVLRNPEITVGIFSHVRPKAKDFLRQIKNEFERNEELKAVYSDVLWLDPKKAAPKWSEDTGIVVKRKTNPKESTIEAHGLVDGMPTGSHFRLRIYDDVVTEKSVTTPDMIRKTTEMRDLSNELGMRGGREWNIGTRYDFSDSYQSLLDRGAVKPRIYPATHDGTINGTPVLRTQAQWNEKVRTSLLKNINAQQLLNPVAGESAIFQIPWLDQCRWEIRPRTTHCYILCDPGFGPSAARRKTDRTAMAVLLHDAADNLYLADGYCHRMRLDDRWYALKELHKKWSRQEGVLLVRVGYERYGMQADLEHFELRQRLEKYPFPIDEVAWPNEGQGSKEARVGRLEPWFKNGRIKLPAVMYNAENATECYWEIGLRKDAGGKTYGSPHIIKKPKQGETRAMRDMRRQGQPGRIASAIKQLNEEKKIYDVLECLFEEYPYFPKGRYDDMLDCIARVFDIEMAPPALGDETINDRLPVYVDS